MDISLASTIVENEAKEQKTFRLSSLLGPLDHDRLQLAGQELARLLEEKGEDVAGNFYLQLSEETVRYLLNHRLYRPVAKRLEGKQVPFIHISKYERTWLDDCKCFFRKGNYDLARKVIDANIGEFSDLRARAPICSLGYDAMRVLCSSGKLEQAKDLSNLFKDFGFEHYLKMFAGTNASA